MPAADNPRVTLTTRHPYGTPQPCLHCDRPVDTDSDYLALIVGTCPHTQLVAVAHPETYNEQDDDWDDNCPQSLRQYWLHLLHDAGAGTPRLACDRGAARWYLCDKPLHAGTSLEILDRDGTWHQGHYEYDLTTGSTPKLYFPLAGWVDPQAALTLTEGAAVRIPTRRTSPADRKAPVSVRTAKSDEVQAGAGWVGKPAGLGGGPLTG